MIYKPNFFIITGGPGVGKTTLLEVLAKQGFPYVPEVARKIIREQVSQNGDALPWANIPAYTHLMLSRSVESFEQHQKQESVLFFDRGIPDTLAYVHLTHQSPSPELQHTVQDFRYNPQVFITMNVPDSGMTITTLIFSNVAVTRSSCPMPRKYYGINSITCPRTKITDSPFSSGTL